MVDLVYFSAEFSVALNPWLASNHASFSIDSLPIVK